MSELTICNYCSWKYKQKVAKQRGEKVKLRPSKKLPGWTAVVYTNKNGKEKESGWYMEMTDHCVC